LRAGDHSDEIRFAQIRTADRRIGYNRRDMIGPVLLLLVALAPASATTAPATSPTGDASTPKGALKAFAQALDAGDRKAVLDLLWAQTDADQKLADATAGLAEAAAQLRRAAAKAFGDEAARPLSVEQGATPEALARIDSAKVQIDGERATVRPEHSEGPPMVLTRVAAGSWKLPVSELSKDVEAADVERNVAALLDQAKLTRQLSEEVSAGKYKTAADARQVLDRRIVQSALPATGPAASSTKPER
jgi:hypothetical protein